LALERQELIRRLIVFARSPTPVEGSLITLREYDIVRREHVR
jgi:hypothetical protein